METRLGADPAALRRLATELDRAGDDLDGAAHAIRRAIESSGWGGPDARRYRSQWDGSHRAALAHASTELSQAARHLRDQASEQERASGVDGSTTGGNGVDRGTSGDRGDSSDNSGGGEPKTAGAGTGHYDADDLRWGRKWDKDGEDPTPFDHDRDDDGVTDDVDPDRNGDGRTDTSDKDRDGIPDFRDDDDDNDGQPDKIDRKIDTGVTFAKGDASHQFFGDQGHTDGEFAGGLGKGEAGGWYGGRVDASGKIGMDEDGAFKAEGKAEVAVGVGGEASVEYGNDYVSGKLAGEAFAGARATADGAVTLGPNGLGVEAGVEAFAGAEASAEGSVTVMGVTGGAEVTGYAGVGVKANADVALGWEKTELDFEFGAALGLGGGVSFSIDLSPKDTLESIGKLADDFLPDIDLLPW